MWYQVLDCPGREGNYLEATCSAMFSYTLLKGVRLGYLDASLEGYAREVYDGLVRTFITEDEAGLLSINQCCSVGGLGGKENRMGDYAYYLSEPIRSNDPKGVGPFIWASLEYEKL
jgi:unsaturated rhamnogalacturonyl hydrolase